MLPEIVLEQPFGSGSCSIVPAKTKIETYPSLVNTSLAMMASDVAEFTLRVWHMRRHRNRLRAKVRKRSLARFVWIDGDGVDLGAKWLIPALRC